MDKIISAPKMNKTETISGPLLSNEEYDPYVIVVLNQL